MDIITDFEKTSRKYSPVAFWFWNGELNPEFLVWQINEMVDKGVYGAFMHARAYLKTPYFEKEWWQAVGNCVKRGHEKGFYTWLYDEYAWPSGTAGSTFELGYQKPSRVLAKGECNMAKELYVHRYKAGEAVKEEDLLAGFTMQNGDIMAFYRRIYPRSVDYLNKQAIRDFLDCTHEEYKKRYGSSFGTVIPGIFFDEIRMIGYPLPWTDNLPTEFKDRCGYDLLEELPYLIEGEDAHAHKVRTDYYRVISELYEEAFFQQISQWCAENNLKLTGHTEENFLRHPRRQGNYFNTVRHLQIPGSDNHDYRYRFPRKITFHEPKFSVSVARAYNRERCMSEAMGGAGWGCSLQEFKRGINTMGAMGINMFTLHGFYNECEHQGSQADWPTSFFYQNPYWKYFKVFSDYISRICYMNSIGRPIVDIALYYPIRELYKDTVAGNANERGIKMYEAFHTTLNNFLCQQMDTDMIDYESICRATVTKGKIQVGQQSFVALVCPSNLSMDDMLEEKLQNFADTGGYLIFYSDGIGKIAPKPFEKYNVYSPMELPDVLVSLFMPDVQVIEGNKTELYVNHRVVNDMHYYMVSNSTNVPRQVTLRLRQAGNVLRMYPEDGKVSLMDSSSCCNGSLVTLKLEADEACFLLLTKQAENRTINKKTLMYHNEVQTVTGDWTFLPLPKDYDSQWDIEADNCILDIPIAVFSSEYSSSSQLIRICNKKGEDGFCGRHISPWKASWIGRRNGWTDDADAEDLYFRKTFWLDDDVLDGQLCVAAVNSFTLYVNGMKVCSSESNRKPLDINIRSYLRLSENIIAIHIHNDTPLRGRSLTQAEFIPPDRIISLLAEGIITTNKENLIIKTDSSWIVSQHPCSGWFNLDVNLESLAKRVDPKKCRSMGMAMDEDAWMYAWERGCPPVLPWGQLPLFGRDVHLPQKIAYMVTLPVGTVQIEKPRVKGVFDCLLDGMPINFDGNSFKLDIDEKTHNLIIQVEAHSLRDGLIKPIRVRVEPCKVLLGDWRMQGLFWFSGRALYRNTIMITKQPEKRYMLDLGDVRFNAEIWVNKKLVGISVWAPYRIDITDELVNGENELCIIVANSAAVERRHMLVDEGVALGWNRYWNEDNIDREPQNLVSGLLGPVNLYII